MASHHALSIDEILSLILQEITDDKATLASCARCSRSFSSLALDLLWRRLDTAAPLNRLLPKSVKYAGVDRVSVISSQNTPTRFSYPRYPFMQTPLEAWKRFDLHANRVYYIHDSLQLSEIFCRISLRKGVVPLPNLRHLCLFELPQVLHLPPLISSMDIGEGLALVADLPLTQCMTQALRLKKLKLAGPIPMTILPTITMMVHLRCLNLHSVHLHKPLEIDAFKAGMTALSTMPGIVEIYLPWIGGAEPTIPACGGFASLELLSSNDVPETLAMFVKTIATQRLRHIHMERFMTVSPADLRHCLTTICSVHGQTLRTIDMGFRCIAMQEGVSYMDTIKPMLNAPNLAYVAFPFNVFPFGSGQAPIEISAENVGLMASAWPRLTGVFNIQSRNAYAAYQTIIAFADLCPGLQSLHIAIQDRCTAPFPVARKCLSYSLRALDVRFHNGRNLPISSPNQFEAFGAWLGQMFPRLTVLRHDSYIPASQELRNLALINKGLHDVQAAFAM